MARIRFEVAVRHQPGLTTIGGGVAGICLQFAIIAALPAEAHSQTDSYARLWASAMQVIADTTARPARDTLIGVVAEQLAARGETDSALAMVSRAAAPNALRHLLIKERVRANDVAGVMRILHAARSRVELSTLLSPLPYVAFEAGRVELLVPLADSLAIADAIELLVVGVRTVNNHARARALFHAPLARLALSDTGLMRSQTLQQAAVALAEFGDLTAVQELRAMPDLLSRSALPGVLTQTALILRNADDPRADSVYSRAFTASLLTGRANELANFYVNYTPPMSDTNPLRYLPRVVEQSRAGFLERVAGYYLLHDSTAVPRQILQHYFRTRDTSTAFEVMDRAISWTHSFSSERERPVGQAVREFADQLIRLGLASTQRDVRDRANSIGYTIYQKVDSVRAMHFVVQLSQPDTAKTPLENSVLALVDLYPDSAARLAMSITDVVKRDELLYYAVLAQFIMLDNFKGALETAELIETPRLRNRALVSAGSHDLFAGDSARALTVFREAMATLDPRLDSHIVAYELSRMTVRLGVTAQITDWALAQTGENLTLALVSALRGLRNAQS